MKHLFLSLSALACLFFFNACSTKVDLYADYKDIPVIYGLLDASADTNYIKIIRAFSGSDENPVDARLAAPNCLRVIVSGEHGKRLAACLPFQK